MLPYEVPSAKSSNALRSGRHSRTHDRALPGRLAELTVLVPIFTYMVRDVGWRSNPISMLSPKRQTGCFPIVVEGGAFQAIAATVSATAGDVSAPVPTRRSVSTVNP